MDQCHPLLLGQGHDTFDVEVSPDWPLLPTQHVGLVGFEAVTGEPIFICKNGHGMQPQLIGGTENAYRDFTPVDGHKPSIGNPGIVQERGNRGRHRGAN